MENPYNASFLSPSSNSFTAGPASGRKMAYSRIGSSNSVEKAALRRGAQE